MEPHRVLRAVESCSEEGRKYSGTEDRADTGKSVTGELQAREIVIPAVNYFLSRHFQAVVCRNAIIRQLGLFPAWVATREDNLD